MYRVTLTSIQAFQDDREELSNYYSEVLFVALKLFDQIFSSIRPPLSKLEFLRDYIFLSLDFRTETYLFMYAVSSRILL